MSRRRRRWCRKSYDPEKLSPPGVAGKRERKSEREKLRFRQLSSRAWLRCGRRERERERKKEIKWKVRRGDFSGFEKWWEIRGGVGLIGGFRYRGFKACFNKVA